MPTPRVDFYILPDQSPATRFACVIAGKAWQQGNVTCLHTVSRESAGALDDLLWTFRDICFIPHALQDSNEEVPVLIGWEDNYPASAQVLINLTASIPSFAGRFSRIVEIVAGDEEQKQQARQRYRTYRELGYEIHNYTLEPDHAMA